jgi:UDP-N-acetylmuramate--alanine ligase
VHNILNATAAIAVGVGLDVGVEAIRTALDQFRGVDRRFQLRGRAAGVSVIDDYGHHPTEIKATLAAAKTCGFRKIHVVFQPHRYTRTRDLMEEFTAAFGDADSLFVLDIYAASEKPIEGITAEALARTILSTGVSHGGSTAGSDGLNVQYVSSFADAVSAAAAAAQDGDMILTLGAGSVSQLGPLILEKLKQREVTN